MYRNNYSDFIRLGQKKFKFVGNIINITYWQYINYTGKILIYWNWLSQLLSIIINR